MKLISIPQAAERLGISPASVRRLADEGKLQAVRPMGPTGHRRIVDVSVDGYLASLLNAPVEPLAAPIQQSKPVHADFASVIARGKALAKSAR